MTVAFGQMLDITYGTSLKWSLINEIWCRFRNSIGTVASLTAPTCICLAAIDQWIITSHSVHHRRWSTRRLAYLTIFLNVSFWFLLTGIPIFIFTGLIPNGNSIVCSYLSQSFATYNNIFFIPIIYCLLPISILTICGILTWKNIQRLRRSLVRQIGRMIFIQITSTIITTVPLCIAAIYLAITTNTMKTLLQQVVESLIVTIARLCFFLAYSYHFYIYLLSSKHMRRIVFEQCLKIKRKVASTLPTHPTRNMAVIPVNP
ncbi:hypothetical protein I4U23_010467 [Adineta vaga]|nr:hypothetical protein I4U23_010467 [Adineta vaga]